MDITAEQFNKGPATAYRRADKGERVEITHGHYPDRVFLLIAEEKKHEKTDVTDSNCA